MIMGPRLRKVALTVHVACSVGSLGAVAGFLALALAGLGGGDAGMARAAYPAMDLTARFVVIPFVFAALLTGLVQALGTPWGPIRHWWVVAKLVATVAVALVLLMQMEGIGDWRIGGRDDRRGRPERGQVLARPACRGGLVALLVPVALSLYKPQGMTRYGWRRRNDPAVSRLSGE